MPHNHATLTTAAELHCRRARNNGVSKEEIRAAIHIVGIYCGVPQAPECLWVTRAVLAEKKHSAKIHRPGFA